MPSVPIHCHHIFLGVQLLVSLRLKNVLVSIILCEESSPIWIDDLRRYLDDTLIVLMSPTAFDPEHFRIMCELAGFFRTDLLTYDNVENIPDRIREYMAD